MFLKAGVCCEAGEEAGAAAGEAASCRTPAVPPDVQLPSAAQTHNPLTG